MRLALLALLALKPVPVPAQEGDRFVWAQLRQGGSWDPYPGVHEEILRFVSSVTSVLAAPERKALALKDPELFSYPFLVLAGRSEPPALDEEEVGRLRNYLTSGGFLWIEDSSGQRSSSFDRWVRGTLKRVFPDSDMAPLGPEHVVHKTFFLLRGAGGRVLVSGALEGIDWGGRTAVLYSRNDILGAWAKDALGKPLYECSPGGETQRMNARKAALNIILYSLTGSYKTDAVHQPFILEKMRLGLPP